MNQIKEKTTEQHILECGQLSVIYTVIAFISGGAFTNNEVDSIVQQLNNKYGYDIPLMNNLTQLEYLPIVLDKIKATNSDVMEYLLVNTY